MKNIIIESFKTPFGELLLGSFEEKLCLCDWKFRRMRKAVDDRIKKGLNTDFEEGNDPILEQTKQQLNEYFDKKRTTFDIPLLLVGTDFQKSVWNALLEIPFGKTQSYLGLSQHLGNEKAIRAVASANGANAHSIVIPCHRIIGSDGDLVGYAGGLDAKKRLLRLESVNIPAEQLEMF